MPVSLKKCPNCRYKNGVKIIYGKPTAELAVLAEKKKVFLSGCEVKHNAPQFHCFSCGHQWTKQDAIKAAYDEIEQIKFVVGGYFQGQIEYNVNFKEGLITKQKAGNENEKKKWISNIEQERYRLSRTNLLDWKASYVQKEIMDGEQWSIELIKQDGIIRKSGSNQYPREWGLFCYFIDCLLKDQQFKNRYNKEKAEFELNFRIVIK